ncbi:urokinase plasminogen activator surface receptor-like [Gastrophryne carolinensis]
MVSRLCAAYETTCISLAYRIQDGSNTVMKGCSTPELCNQTSIIDTGTRSIYMTATCCETNNCNINRFSTNQVYSNRLQCKACESQSQSCPSNDITTTFCDEVNNNCVDIVTKSISNNVISYSYVKGCGSSNIGDACTNLYAYDTGNIGKSKLYTYFSCCNTDNCNAGQTSIPILSNNNGINCHGCVDNGNNECAEQNQSLVSCTGIMIRCMEVFDQNRRTIMKGCSTVAFCSSTFPSRQVPNASEIMCCAGNLCNNFTRDASATTIITTSSATSPNTDFRLLVLFLILLYAIMKH